METKIYTATPVANNMIDLFGERYTMEKTNLSVKDWFMVKNIVPRATCYNPKILGIIAQTEKAMRVVVSSWATSDVEFDRVKVFWVPKSCTEVVE